MLGVKQSFTASYSPQADGQAEKAIGTLHNTLSKMVGNDQKRWDLLLPYALWAYRSAQHATTGETPYFLIYGRDPSGPLENRVKQWVVEHKNLQNYTEAVAERLLKARRRVIEATKVMKLKNMKDFNKGKIENPFKVDDIVWHKLERAKPTENRKLTPKFDGPWKVTSLVEDEHGLNLDLVHTNNPNVTKRASIRKLKKAFLRPVIIPYQEDMEELIKVNPQTEGENAQKESNIPVQKRVGPVINRKGTTIRTQKKRARQIIDVKDDRDEFEVDHIIKERVDPKSKETEYLIKWVGYRQTTWEPLSNMINSDQALEEWNRNKKISSTAIKPVKRKYKKRKRQ
jgi:hypothetical protein